MVKFCPFSIGLFFWAVAANAFHEEGLFPPDFDDDDDGPPPPPPFEGRGGGFRGGQERGPSPFRRRMRGGHRGSGGGEGFSPANPFDISNLLYPNVGSSRFDRRGRGFGRRRFCPRWNSTFEESKCLWPGDENALDSIPDSCKPTSLIESLPEPVIQYYKDKGKELVDLLKATFKDRGITKPCGFCRRKLACRKRRKSKRSRRFPRLFGCKEIDVRFVNEECDDNAPCELSLVNGACPAPIPQAPLVKRNFVLGRKVLPRILRRRAAARLGKLFFEAQEGDDDDLPNSGKRGDAKNETIGSRIKEHRQSSSEEYSRESSKESGSDESSSSSSESESGEKKLAKKRRYTPFIPYWHCQKSSDGKKCLCCCGSYFPDPKSNKCVLVKRGSRFPPLDFGGNRIF